MREFAGPDFYRSKFPLGSRHTSSKEGRKDATAEIDATRGLNASHHNSMCFAMTINALAFSLTR
jgi:hypothetical protein